LGLRAAGLRVVRRFGLAAPVERLAAGFRAADERLAAAPEDFARVDVDFFAVLRFGALRFAVERLAVDLRAPLLRADVERDELPELAVALPSIVHLPLITRCAASATASAINVPSLVALATTLLAACEAVSAASRPASRIARRALGLALIAAAAAARPAASISLLIAAFASLSTVSLLEELFLEDLAIASSPFSCGKDTSRL
jgi:hypothetical protein